MIGKKEPARRVPSEAAATIEEIEAAIRALSTEELVRLTKYAAFRVRGIRAAYRKARDGGELLGDALTSTLDGSRRWRRSVPFAQHLRGVMRSMGGHWASDANPDRAVPASAVMTVDSQGGLIDPIEEASSGAPSQERQLMAREKLEILRREFAKDDLVLLIIDGLGEEYAPGELPDLLGVSKAEVVAALKKLRRHARTLFPGADA